MPTISWYVKRLRIMSTRELFYRIRQQLTLLSLRIQYKVGIGLANPPAASTSFEFCSEKRQLPTWVFDLERLKQDTIPLLDGRVPVAGITWEWEDSAETWHRAPDTGRRWPRCFFGSIKYREGNPYGDVRQLWEPARLQHLVNLATIATTGNRQECEQTTQIVKKQLASWIEFNPPLAGAHYISAMECALRIIAVCHALDILRDELKDQAPWKALVYIVGSHAPLIERRLSLYSSSGNHTTAEATGLVYAGLLFPEMKGSKRWFNKGLSILADAAQDQVLPDGGGVEQALSYHHFNIQLLSMVEGLLEHHGRPRQAEISAAVARGTRFLAAIRYADGRLPSIGDSDGGHALSAYLQVAACCDEPNLQAYTFRDSGYTVAYIGGTPELSLVFDHGPLGLQPAYGHGHADALNLLLRAHGEDIFIDPGTYTYTGDPIWRRYFRGTSAHNTITVDGRDQANQDGCFLWTSPMHAHLLASDINEKNNGRLVAEHDGYVEAGVRHVRGVAWVRNQWLLIWDGLYGDGTHVLELHWHLAGQPNWIDDDTFELQQGGEKLKIQCQGGAISTHVGERDPIIGWQSLLYGSIEPVATVKVYHHASLPHTFTTMIRLPGSHPNENAMKDALKWIKHRAQ